MCHTGKVVSCSEGKEGFETGMEESATAVSAALMDMLMDEEEEDVWDISADIFKF